MCLVFDSIFEGFVQRCFGWSLETLRNSDAVFGGISLKGIGEMETRGEQEGK